MGKKLKRALSTMRFAGEGWSAEREENVLGAAGDVGTIVARAVMGRRCLDFTSGVSLVVVCIEWPARSSEGHLTLRNPATGEMGRRRCVYDVMTHNIKMYPA